MFRPAASQTPATEIKPNTTENGQQQQAANPGADPTKVPGAEPAKVSAMDEYKDLWQPTPKVEGQVEEPDFNPEKIFDLNAESMGKALAQVDFAKSITEEQVAAVQAGGPEAVKALMDMLNSTARQTMGAATQASAKMIEKALTGAQGSLDKKINSQVRQNQIASHLQETNPLVNHPAAAPMVQAMQAQFAAKFPKASPQEISEKVTQYLSSFSDLAQGKKSAESEASEKSEGTDWESYFTR